LNTAGIYQVFLAKMWCQTFLVSVSALGRNASKKKHLTMCQRFSSYFRVLLYKPNKGEKFSQLQEVGGNGRNCIISEQAGSNANHGENDDFPWKDAAAEEAMHYCELLI